MATVSQCQRILSAVTHQSRVRLHRHMLRRYKVKMQLDPNFMFHLVYLFIHVYIHSPGEHCHLAEKSEDAIGSNFQIRLIWEEWGCSWIRFPNWICLGIPLSSGGIRLAFERRYWYPISQISGVWVWSLITCLCKRFAFPMNRNLQLCFSSIMLI